VRRRRLADRRAALSDEMLASEGVARTRLGYEVLVKLKRDELLEQAYLPPDVSRGGSYAEITAT
jgi:hypothetical protein